MIFEIVVGIATIAGGIAAIGSVIIAWLGRDTDWKDNRGYKRRGRITWPKNGSDNYGRMIDLEGYVKEPRPEASYWIVVEPELVQGKWWPHSIQIKANGLWKLDWIAIGAELGKGGENDIKKTFTIVLLEVHREDEHPYAACAPSGMEIQGRYRKLHTIVVRRVKN